LVFVLAVAAVLAGACTRSTGAPQSIAAECGSVEHRDATSLDVRSVATGVVVRYRVDSTTRYFGIRDADALASGTPVRVEGVRHGATWHADSVVRNDCGITPSFDLRCEQPPPSNQGAQVTASDQPTAVCTVASRGQFYSAVDLSCGDLPPGLTCTFTPNPVTPPPGGTRTAGLEIEYLASFAGGTVSVPIEGLSAGRQTRHLDLAVTLPGRQVATARPPGSDLTGGGGGSGGRTGLPAGRGTGPATGQAPAGQGPPPPPAGGPGSPPGEGAASPPANPNSPGSGPPEFALSCSPQSLRVQPGRRANAVCSVSFTGGSTETVSLACPAVAPTVMCSLSPGTVKAADSPSAAPTVNVAFEAAPSATPATFDVSLEARGHMTRSFKMAVSVVEPTSASGPAGPDFALACDASGLTVARGQAATLNCGVTSTAGFAQPAILSCEGVVGAACAFKPTTVAPPPGGVATAELTVVTTRALAAGSYAFRVSARSGNTTRTFNLQLVVTDR
jgi:hypothetical protein